MGGSLLAVLGGLGAAVCFTVSALCASSSSQEIGAESTLAWVMLIGLVLVVAPTAVLADPAQLSPTVLALLAAAGVSNVAGLLLEYVAFRRGKVGGGHRHRLDRGNGGCRDLGRRRGAAGPADRAAARACHPRRGRLGGQPRRRRAVFSSQFAALTAVAAYFIHGQRLTRSQLAGLAAVVAGVTLLSAFGP